MPSSLVITCHDERGNGLGVEVYVPSSLVITCHDERGNGLGVEVYVPSSYGDNLLR